LLIIGLEGIHILLEEACGEEEGKRGGTEECEYPHENDEESSKGAKEYREPF
jgi:hypothetical protein